MRKGLIFTALLAAMLVGALVLSVSLMQQQNERQEVYLRQTQLLRQQSAELDRKETELNELVRRYENGLTDGTAELEALRQELEVLHDEKEALQAQLDQAIADVEAMRLQLENEDSDQSYYLEVYNALTEGLNKVKGYIAGR